MVVVRVLGEGEGDEGQGCGGGRVNLARRCLEREAWGQQAVVDAGSLLLVAPNDDCNTPLCLSTPLVGG